MGFINDPDALGRLFEALREYGRPVNLRELAERYTPDDDEQQDEDPA